MIGENEQAERAPASGTRHVLARGSAGGRQGQTRRIVLVLAALLTAAALTVYVLLPSWPGPGEDARRLKCSSNLRQIGMAIAIYSKENGGIYPRSLEEVLLNADVTPDVFICPYTGDVPASGKTPQEWIRDFRQPGHCSFLYVIGGVPQSTLTANHVIAHDAPTNHGADGINALHGDGHIEWVPRRDVAHFIAELQAGHNPPRSPSTRPSEL